MSSKVISTAVMSVLLLAGVPASPSELQVEFCPERPTRTVAIGGPLLQANCAYWVSDMCEFHDPHLRLKGQGGQEVDVSHHKSCAPTWPHECSCIWYTRVNLQPGLWRLEHPDGEPILEFEVGARLQRGDANADLTVDISESISILGFLFLGEHNIPCLDAADTNNSDEVDISDAVRLLQFLFLDAAPPPPPFGECYYDAPNALTCECYPTACEGPDPDPSFTSMITILRGWGLNPSQVDAIALDLLTGTPCGSQ